MVAARDGIAFAATGVTKQIGAATLLEDVSLAIRAGEKVALIGPSGAGKTTLLRLLGGVLWPTRGRVESLGHDTRALRGAALARLRARIGFLHQSDNLIPGLRVVHNVAMGRLGRIGRLRALRALLWPQEVAELRAALARVEMADKLWAVPGTLSGGEQQRVALARLLVQQPDAVLADEPVSALDVRLGRQVMGQLCELVDERATTLVASLHDLSLLDNHFDRVLAIRDGRLCWDRPPGEVSRELLAELYGAEFARVAGSTR